MTSLSFSCVHRWARSWSASVFYKYTWKWETGYQSRIESCVSKYHNPIHYVFYIYCRFFTLIRKINYLACRHCLAYIVLMSFVAQNLDVRESYTMKLKHESPVFQFHALAPAPGKLAKKLRNRWIWGKIKNKLRTFEAEILKNCPKI